MLKLWVGQPFIWHLTPMCDLDIWDGNLSLCLTLYLNEVNNHVIDKLNEVIIHVKYKQDF
jgi:hypothetical protein